MIGFLFLLILGGVGAACIVASVVMAKPQEGRNGLVGIRRWPFAVAGAALVVVSGVALLLSSVVTIGPSDVGIVTAFGHTVGSDLGPGIHLKAPWDTVTTWDDSVQRTAFESGKGETGCLEIRIANQQSACLDVIVFWKDKASASDGQFKQFRTFPRVEAAYFSRGVVTKFFNNVFESYDPVALASATPTSGAKGQSSFRGGATVSSLTARVLANMQAAYADVAGVTSLNAGQIRYNPQVESALSRVITGQANVNVSRLNVQAAANQATANADLQKAGTLTPSTVEQNCLTVTAQILQSGGNLPPAWNCTGSGASVIVGGRTG